ncbi:K+-dependent Na+/Ca+ exchanger family protein [Necator americanus]|uniref:K+-dependent Na+/Ca+ exchanger family protein n=1 Tax=Necator americanus TaxID=51031 RepID=W2TLI5_NECAM|nr:K+-dependent Na+/Ca+ exchanger family protein [Necator americanus]ETN81882.1 K+-dependent Na+/Ca+ exchanger family protein [Necator americanus]
MFVSLAIVCDEFFVPSLAVLTEKLSISDDVAGATFMAAGGSAPEFFTSVIGVFIAQNNVGIGTIVGKFFCCLVFVGFGYLISSIFLRSYLGERFLVWTSLRRRCLCSGSATFNILCVLACCTLFSKTVLQLTWWPLFRDVSIYILALLMLVLFFMDEKITWPEALSLFIVYLVYCTVMKFNVVLEEWVKTKVLGEKLEEEDELPEQTTFSTPMTVRINGNNNTSIEYKDSEEVPKTERSMSMTRRTSMGRRQSIPILHSGTMFRTGIMQLMHQTLDDVPEGGSEEEEESPRRSPSPPSAMPQPKVELTVPIRQDRRSSQIEEIKSLLEEEEEQPLNMEWPDTFTKRVTYICLAPVLIPMWVTIPDVRRPASRKWYPLTFVNSILWIAFFSYLMVWWANTIGETLVIPTEVIGLTILAAGTSIPDLITSVIVARKGLGDMAVSSSVGSNIFDVCVGLPVPWLLFFIVQLFQNPGNPAQFISVSSKGLLCSVGMLFIMLVVLVFSTFISRWRMNKAFGVIMIVSYIAFCLFSVALETDRLKCPLNLC